MRKGPKNTMDKKFQVLSNQTKREILMRLTRNYTRKNLEG
jgi:hypothetical protein